MATITSIVNVGLLLFLIPWSRGNAKVAARKRQVFAYVTECGPEVYRQFDWSVITIASFYSTNTTALQEFIRYAQSKKAAVLFNSGTLSDKTLKSAAARKKWVREKVSAMQDLGMNGINFDYESEVKAKSSKQKALIDLVEDMNDTLKKIDPKHQLALDVPVCPNCWNREYDIKSLSRSLDLIFVMAYDLGGSNQRANSNYTKVLEGISEYKKMGIPTTKLILGVPWYGYNWACGGFDENKNECVQATINEKSMDGQVDLILKDSWLFNTQLGKAKKNQYHSTPSLPFDAIFHIIRKFNITPKWDKKSRSHYFNYNQKNSAQMHQVWYDDPRSLGEKYQIVKKFDLGGAGMWTANCLDQLNSPAGKKIRKQFWDLLAFK